MEHLSDELQRRVLNLAGLPAHRLAVCRCVNRAWSRNASDEQLWLKASPAFLSELMSLTHPHQSARILRTRLAHARQRTRTRADDAGSVFIASVCLQLPPAARTPGPGLQLFSSEERCENRRNQQLLCDDKGGPFLVPLDLNSQLCVTVGLQREHDSASVDLVSNAVMRGRWVPGGAPGTLWRIEHLTGTVGVLAFTLSLLVEVLIDASSHTAGGVRRIHLMVVDSPEPVRQSRTVAVSSAPALKLLQYASAYPALFSQTCMQPSPPLRQAYTLVVALWHGGEEKELCSRVCDNAGNTVLLRGWQCERSQQCSAAELLFVRRRDGHLFSITCPALQPVPLVSAASALPDDQIQKWNKHAFVGLGQLGLFTVGVNVSILRADDMAEAQLSIQRVSPQLCAVPDLQELQDQSCATLETVEQLLLFAQTHGEVLVG